MSIEKNLNLFLDHVGEGNPGTIVIIFRMLSHTDQKINDDNLRLFYMMYSKGIRGTGLYCIFTDACDRNLDKFRIAMQDIDAGLIDLDELRDVLATQDRERIKNLFTKGE